MTRTKGARAMLAAKAMLATPPEPFTPRGAQLRAAHAADVAHASVSKALTILEYAPDLADDVTNGASLNAAYAEAQRRKAAQAPAAERRRLADFGVPPGLNDDFDALLQRLDAGTGTEA